MTGAAAGRLQVAYRRLPPEVRRCLRPLNLVEEGASLLPARLRAPAETTAEASRRLLALPRVRFAVRRVEGTTREGDRPLRCVFAMDDGSARYWRAALLGSEVREETCDHVGAFDLVRAVDRLEGDADITLARLPWPLGRFLRREMLVPSHLPMWLRTDRPLDKILVGGPRGRASAKDEARRALKLDLTVRISRERVDLEHFRRDLYEPYVRSRFGDLCQVIPEHTFRHALRQGWLLVLEQGSRPVAGQVIERWGRDLRLIAFGVAVNGAPGPALSACYYNAILFAVARKFPRLSLGSVRPLLSDGVLRYKRKWGAALGWPVTWDVFLLRVRNTAAARAALTATPLVVERGRALSALVGMDGLEPRARVASVDTPGLSEILVLGGEGMPLGGLSGPYSHAPVIPAGLA